MNHSMKSVFLCLAVMAANLTMAQRSTAEPLVARSSSSVRMLLGPKVDCPGTLVCPVPVTLALTSEGGCQVTARSPINLAPNQLVTRIVWTLSPTSFPTDPPNTTYSFQPDYGILVVADGGRQIARSGLGDGSTASIHVYNVLHLRNRWKDDVTYLPVVLRTVPPATIDGEPDITLCGASDPKIVNN